MSSSCTCCDDEASCMHWASCTHNDNETSCTRCDKASCTHHNDRTSCICCNETSCTLCDNDTSCTPSETKAITCIWVRIEVPMKGWPGWVGNGVSQKKSSGNSRGWDLRYASTRLFTRWFLLTRSTFLRHYNVQSFQSKTKHAINEKFQSPTWSLPAP